MAATTTDGADDHNFATVSMLCYNSSFENDPIVSKGVFLGDNPFDYSLPTLLMELCFIFVTSRAIHYVLRPLGQSRIISQVLTGIFLGPTVLGHSSRFSDALFPPRNLLILDNLSLLSLILFLFMVGVKTDVSLLKKSGKRALALCLTSCLIPYFACGVVHLIFNKSIPSSLSKKMLLMYLVGRLSLSSFPVIASALDELGLLNSELGRVVLSATLIADVISYALHAVSMWYIMFSRLNSPGIAVAAMGSVFGLALLICFVARPAVLWVIKRTPTGELVSEGCFLGMVLVALLSACASESTGYQITLGPFLLGLAMPGGMPLGVTLNERLESFLSGLFLPLYMVMGGYRTDFGTLDDSVSTRFIVLMVVVNYALKLVAAVLTGLYYKRPLKDAAAMGLMLNLKGIMEINFFYTWGRNEIITPERFTLLMVCLVVNTAITNPLIKLLYNPDRRYVSNKRRTVQHLKPNHPFRILACVHGEDHVAPVIDILEAATPTPASPFMLYLLHLTELAGRAVAVLRPHKRRRNSNADPSPSDRIVNAFRYFENQRAANAVSLSPFVAISPIATMHNDVCSLALDKKCRLVILPFHKVSDGARETSRAAVQGLNRNVLDLAPCSVAILVDRGGVTCTMTNHLLQRAVVYFLGGPDDREALAIAMRMAAGGVALTVVRFRVRGGDEAVDEEDEELIGELRMRYGEVEGVLYVEKVVMDGEGTVAIVRDMSDKYDLVIVGRRKGEESELTRGLSAWSECPELGIVGDLLATTDFGGKVAILVVQQQVMAGGREGHDRCGHGGLRLLGHSDPM